MRGHLDQKRRKVVIDKVVSRLGLLPSAKVLRAPSDEIEREVDLLTQLTLEGIQFIFAGLDGAAWRRPRAALPHQQHLRGGEGRGEGGGEEKERAESTRGEALG